MRRRIFEDNFHKHRRKRSRPRQSLVARSGDHGGRLPVRWGLARATGPARRTGGSKQGSRTMRKQTIGLGAAVGLALLSSAAYAATATSSFQVRITITAQCLAATTTDLDFGTSGFLSANIDAQSSIQVQCTNTTPYNVGFDKGVNGSSVTARQLKGGPSNELINYAIYSNAGRSTNWGNTVGTDTV